MAKKNRATGKTTLEPLADRVVIKPVQQEQVLASGIVIPDTAQEKPQQGEVIAVGPGKRDDKGNHIPIDIQVGNRILYKKYTGQDIKVEQEDLIVLEEREILAKVLL